MRSKKVITVDFDFTLAKPDEDGFLTPIYRVIEFVKQKYKEGFEIHIVTFRHQQHKQEVRDFCTEFNIPIKSIVCTASANKVPFIKKLHSVLHIDDNVEVCLLVSLSGIGVLLVDHKQEKYNSTAKLFNKI